MAEFDLPERTTVGGAKTWFQEQRAAKRGVFALVDGDQGSVGQWQPVQRMPRTAQVNLFAARTTNADALAVAPRLFALADDSENERLLQVVDGQSAELPRCLLIATLLSLSELVARLQRRIDVIADGDDMMLRFWDSRIFLSLHQSLPVEVRDRLMAFGDEALVSNRRGGWAWLQLKCPAHDPLQDGPCRLSREDMKVLGASARADAMLGMLRQQTPEVLAAVADEERHPLAVAQLAECLQRGLQSPRDQALALSLAIEHGPDWWAREEWVECVEHARSSSLLKAYLHRMEAA
ncbi:hypothetical protein N799_03165 [Lysobacter arseniciresistens ZS79]|uniref:DUF4123 domain-containing protein n=1 Tax=Lysobacter arseniciresistens ZS79 TaxID=913325 RepID=A0A0A0F5B2_9GAMM|nr:DUF4123 domain-containing protein [Lysobacter arseniciresistens]KGM56567.1 hypothetical protein N799_03165 [Lysobacter arseniciresistens ZS79]